MKRPKLFVVHVSNETHSEVMDNLAGTMITCPGEINLGFYDMVNAFFFFLDDGDCGNSNKIKQDIFSREEVQRHDFLALFRGPCHHQELTAEPNTSNQPWIMHRYNYYDKEIIASILHKNLEQQFQMEDLFSPFPMNVCKLHLKSHKE